MSQAEIVLFMIWYGIMGLVFIWMIVQTLREPPE